MPREQFLEIIWAILRGITGTRTPVLPELQTHVDPLDRTQPFGFTKAEPRLNHAGEKGLFAEFVSHSVHHSFAVAGKYIGGAAPVAWMRP